MKATGTMVQVWFIVSIIKQSYLLTYGAKAIQQALQKTTFFAKTMMENTPQRKKCIT
jgi:hypothetical protein